MTNEEEEFEFRARAEAEAEQKAPEKPGLLSRIGSELKIKAGAVLNQFNRVPASIRGYVQGFQDRKTDNPLDENSPLGLAWQGLKDPESVQSSAQMMAGFGADTFHLMQMKYPHPEDDPNNMTVGNPFNPGGQKAPGKMAPGMSNAETYGTAFDVAAPTGLEGLPFFLKAFGAAAKLPVKAAVTGIDAARGGTEAADIIQGTKQGLGAYKTREIAKANEVLNPKLAPDANKYKATGQALGFTPEELNHPAIDYGENSVQARRQKVLAQGEGGGPYLEQHNAMTEKIQNGFDKAVQSIGGKPLEPIEAGQLIRQGVQDGAKRIADGVTMTHNDIIEKFPGLSINGAEADKLNSALKGVERFATGRATRGVVPEQRAAANSLLSSVDAINSSNMSYKQLNEARDMIGDVAFQDVGAIGKLPAYQQKMRDLYFAINDALINTVGKLDKVREGQFRVPGESFEPLKQKLIESNKTLSDLFENEGSLGRAVGDATKAPEQVFNQSMLYGDTRKIQALREILTPEQFAALKGSYINALVKRGKEGFTYKAAKNAMANNRSVLGEMFKETPEQIKNVSDIIDLGDRVGPPLLPGSAGQLDFGGANTFSKVLSKATAPLGDITAEIGKVRSKALPRSPNGIPLNELPWIQAAKAARVDQTKQNLPPWAVQGVR